MAAPSPPPKPYDRIRKDQPNIFPELSKLWKRYRPQGATKPDTFKELAIGGTSVVYKLTASHVVKVTIGARYVKKLSTYKHIHDTLTTHVRARTRRRALEHFYVGSTFHTSKVTDDNGEPKYLYEVMEYLPTDLTAFASDPHWTLQEVLDIVCQLLHGIKLFHRKNLILTDLKLGNVLIDPVSTQHTGKVALSDFAESYDPTTTATKHRYMKTYLNPHAKLDSLAEDVWRLGLCVLNFLQYRVHQLNDAAKKPDELMSGIRNVLKDKQQTYNYDTLVKPDVDVMKRTLLNDTKHTNPSAKIAGAWKQLFAWVERMLHTDATKRPTIDDVLYSQLFRGRCFSPRTDYAEDFGDKYRTSGKYTAASAKDNSAEDSSSQHSSKSRSQSRSESQSRSQSRSQSKSHSRSQSRSESRSKSRSKSRSASHSATHDSEPSENNADEAPSSEASTSVSVQQTAKRKKKRARKSTKARRKGSTTSRKAAKATTKRRKPRRKPRRKSLHNPRRSASKSDNAIQPKSHAKRARPKLYFRTLDIRRNDDPPKTSSKKTNAAPAAVEPQTSESSSNEAEHESDQDTPSSEPHTSSNASNASDE